MNTPKVSVVVPVYNVERYIDKCAHSLFSQTLDDMEYIFVDDKSPDNSIALMKSVLEKYPHRSHQVRVITMEQNSRQAAVRDRGVWAATGEYIIHCDPDDWVDPDFYRRLYDTAKTGDYDIVCSNYIMEWEGRTCRPDEEFDLKNPHEAIFTDRYSFFSLCMFLVKSGLIKDNNIHFYQNVNLMEDWGFLLRVLFFAKSVSYVPDVYYHYRKDNPGSITAPGRMEAQIDQQLDCIARLDSFFLKHGIGRNKVLVLMRMKRDLKNRYLHRDSIRKWRRLFPETAYYEFRHSEGGTAYRWAFLLSHIFGSNVMKLFLKLKGL